MSVRTRHQPDDPARSKVASSKVNFRVRQEDRELFERAAEAHGETLTHFFVKGGRERAERLLADRRTFTVGQAGWDVIVDAMDRPADAKPELVELFTRRPPE